MQKKIPATLQSDVSSGLVRSAAIAGQSHKPLKQLLIGTNQHITCDNTPESAIASKVGQWSAYSVPCEEGYL